MQEIARVILQAIGLEVWPEFEAALFDGAREKIVFGGWRAGKSSLGAAEIQIEIPVALAKGKAALYWLVGPDYKQTEQEFNFLKEWNVKLGSYVEDSSPLEGPRLLRLAGGITVETKSAQYPERLGSVAPDKIIVCEAGQVSGEVKTWLEGRTLEKGARIVYTGTLEEEEAHQQWAWYIEEGQRWLGERDSFHAAYSLPSWSNPTIFRDCRFLGHGVPATLTCEQEGEHGPGHGGRNHPEILYRERSWRQATGGDHTFLRRIAGVPTGVQFQVYPQLDLTHLLDIPSRRTEWLGLRTGGIDWGTVHPSALCAVMEDQMGIAWVREWPADSTGSADWLQFTRLRLSRQWGIYVWGTDPNERYMARSFQAQSVSGSPASREARIGLVTARLNSGRLRFDEEGPGVSAGYEEMRRVHRRKTRSGEVVLVRLDDDRTAALENAIEMMDGQLRTPPARVGERHYSQTRRREFVRGRK